MKVIGCVCCRKPCTPPRTIVCHDCGTFLARIRRGDRPEKVFNDRGTLNPEPDNPREAA